MIVRISPRPRSSSSGGGEGTRVGAKRSGRLGDAGARFGGPGIQGVEQAVELQVREPAHVRERPGEQQPPVAHVGEPAEHPGAALGERVQVERLTARRAGQLHRGQAAGPDEIVHLVVALVEDARRLHPPQDVRPAVAAGHPDVLSHGDADRPPVAQQLVGDLDAARRGADDQDAALGHLVRVPVLDGREGGDLRREGLPERRRGRDVAGARGEHDGIGRPVPLVRVDRVAPIPGSAQRSHRGVGVDRSRALPGVAVDQPHDLAGGHVAVRIVPVVRESGEPAEPVWGEQPQRVPALRAPGVRDLTALEDHVVDRACGEAATHGQPAVAGSHDHHGDVRHGRLPPFGAQFTSTVMFVGLVSTSNTAERFCDWATSASMSFGLASASMS